MTQAAQSQQPMGTRERDQLVLDHIPLVRRMASKLLSGSRVSAEFEDLVSAGTVGLMEAAESFRPERGVKFSTFAVPRIRGAMLDDLRKVDHAPRSVRKRLRLIARAQATLRSRLHRQPREDETAEELGISLDELRTWKRNVAGADTLSLDTPIQTEEGDGTTYGDLLSGVEGEKEIAGGIVRDQVLEQLRNEISKLDDRERMIIILYYYENLKLKEIAEVLDVTESRVSQIRSATEKKLRELMVGLR